MYRKILIPLDGSKLAEVALAHIEQLTWELSSSLALPGTDLIAMSTHGRSGLSRRVYGSGAAKVLQGATRPVLFVRAKREG